MVPGAMVSDPQQGYGTFLSTFICVCFGKYRASLLQPRFIGQEVLAVTKQNCFFFHFPSFSFSFFSQYLHYQLPGLVGYLLPFLGAVNTVPSKQRLDLYSSGNDGALDAF